MKLSTLNCRNLSGCLFGILLIMSQMATAQDARLSVDASQVLKRISPFMYGSCIEDVNHEIYGGLYDQKIFGESFEEPSSNINFEGFTKQEGDWILDDPAISVFSWPGAKIVNTSPSFADGSAEVNIKFIGATGENAGIIFHVSESGGGADNFNGYEISLSRSGNTLRLGKHQHNYTLLRDVSVTFKPEEWTNLRVEMIGSRILVYINNAEIPALDYTDINNPIISGTVGLRTWYSDVTFKDLILKTTTETIARPFQLLKASYVSKQWDIIKNVADSVIFCMDEINPFNGINAQLVNYIKGTGKAGVANKGLNRWGIAVKEGQVFQGRLYLRANDFTGVVTVALQSADGTKTYASQTLSTLTESWEKYPFTLTSLATDPEAIFVVLMDSPGKLWIDQVVLMQTGDQLFKGLPCRADIGNSMVAEGLNFLRYGGTMVNAPEYRFKKMIGDPDLRPPYQGHWNNFSTNGFGIEDFLKFSEAANFTAAFAINIEETAADAADMVEYLNGDISTVWGAKRAANGHPEPYRVKYIEIGNEEVIEGDDYNTYLHYLDRFDELYTAMHEKDSSIQFINAAWWRSGSTNMKMIFDRLNGKAAYWDLHIWADDAFAGTNVDNDLTDMQNYFLTWDSNTTMKCAILEENGNLHNMRRALGHATTLNAVRRHSDFLLTSCAANALQPYLQNDNGWDQGQIFFTPTQVWGMPPFYAQQMASANHLPLLVSTNQVIGLDITATKSEMGDTLILHVVNTKSYAKKTIVSIQGFSGASNMVDAYTLSGALASENTPDLPEKIKTVSSLLQVARVDSFNYSFPANSYTILRFVPLSVKIQKVSAEESLKIYPNPTNNCLVVENSQGEIEILDSNGKIIMIRNIALNKEVDISGLNAGVYYVRSKGLMAGKAVKLIKN